MFDCIPLGNFVLLEKLLHSFAILLCSPKIHYYMDNIFCTSDHYTNRDFNNIKLDINMDLVPHLNRLSLPGMLYTRCWSIFYGNPVEHLGGQALILVEKALLTISVPVHPKGVLIGLRSRLCAGQSCSSTPNSSNHVFRDFALCNGAQSCWNRKGLFPNRFQQNWKHCLKCLVMLMH